jgi:hypothetical protein
MMDELINKIAADTGLPASTVAPVLGALLAHLGDVLPAPIAHHLAVALGVHQGTDANASDANTSDANSAGGNPGAGGVLGGLAGELLGSGNGAPGAYPGATSLVNVAESLMSSFLAGRR